jgi:hypothetical protein
VVLCFLVALSLPLVAFADFSGAYEENQWTLKNYGGDGGVDWSPDSCYLDSGYTGSGTLAQAEVTLRIPKSGTVYFQWAFFGGLTSGYRLSWLRNGSATILANRLEYAEGANSFAVTAGDIIGFRVSAPKNDDFTSLSQIFSFFAPGQEPAILLQPLSQTACQGYKATFSASATNASDYQWQFNNQNISGETFEDMDIIANAPADSGSYRMIARNPLGSVISQAVQLRIDRSPTITGQPIALINEGLGRTATFSTVALGTNLKYRWRHNGLNIPGATSASLVLSNLTAADAGTYSVSVANQCGEAFSIESRLTITNAGIGMTITRGSNQTIVVDVQNATGQYVLESSTNLLDWRPMMTNLVIPNTPLFEKQVEGETRFYRVRPLIQ